MKFLKNLFKKEIEPEYAQPTLYKKTLTLRIYYREPDNTTSYIDHIETISSYILYSFNAEKEEKLVKLRNYVDEMVEDLKFAKSDDFVSFVDSSIVIQKSNFVCATIIY